MKENGVIGSIIDNLAGNSIANEQAKIIELEKQKILRLYKHLQNDSVTQVVRLNSC